jgi:F420-0:gamma-glutamyl ligase-like protein
MLLLLQLLNDTLDGFANEELQAIQSSFPRRNILSLDNFSDQWLINAAYEEIKKEAGADIIIIRDDEAEFNSLQQLLYQLPQLKQVKILYLGIKDPLIDRMSNFKKIEIKTADPNSSLAQQATAFFAI